MMPIVKKTNKTKRNLSYYHVNKFALVGILRAIEQDNNAIQKRYYLRKECGKQEFFVLKSTWFNMVLNCS